MIDKANNFANWMEILDYARWAPSPHNIQSWRFKLVSSDHAILMYDPDRLLPDTDPTGRFCTAGFGILREMMDIAAAPLGLSLEVEYLSDLDATKTGPQPYANLRLVKRSQPEPLHRDLILERRTSRLPYDDKPVSQVVLDELTEVAAGFGHKLEFSVDPKQVRWVVRLNADTMFFDMSDPVARGEVGSWIRFSMDHARRTRDGLAAYAMHFPGWLMKLFVHHNWLFRLPLIYPCMRYFYELSMRGTRTVAWLSGPFTKMPDCERAGRMMARLWLTMTKHGVYLHPFGSIITNQQSHARMEEHFANKDRQDDLWMLVRLGHSNEPPRAKRLSLVELLVQ